MTKVCFFGCFARFIGTRLVYIDGDDIKYSKSGESIGLIWKELHESFIRSYYKIDCFLCVPLFFSDRNNEAAVEIRFIATLSVFRWWNFVLTLRRSDLLFFLYGTFFLNRLEEDKRKIRDKRIYYISYIILCVTGRNFCCTAIYECMFFFISSYFFSVFLFLIICSMLQRLFNAERRNYFETMHTE